MGLLAGGGFLMSGPGTDCGSYMANSLLVATDFCFIFDCQNGFLGGVIDPCAGVGGGTATGEDDTAAPLFSDCPTGP